MTTINTAASGDGLIVIRWKPSVDNGGSPLTDFQVYMDDGVHGWVLQSFPDAFPHGYVYTQSNCIEGQTYRFFVRSSWPTSRLGGGPDVSETTMTLQWNPPLSCTSTLTGCNGSHCSGMQFDGVNSVAEVPVVREIQRLQTTVAPPVPEIQVAVDSLLRNIR